MNAMNYIESDLPEGTTLKEWRKAKASEKPKRSFKLPSLLPAPRPRFA